MLKYHKHRASRCFARFCAIEEVTLYDLGGSMIKKFGFACLLGLALVSGVSSASAVGPVNSVGASVNIQRDLLDASFFGRPYP